MSQIVKWQKIEFYNLQCNNSVINQSSIQFDKTDPLKALKYFMFSHHIEFNNNLFKFKTYLKKNKSNIIAVFT